MSKEKLTNNAISAPAENHADVPQTASTKAAVRTRLVEKIRSELNIEKWPAIWQPAKSKNKPALRVMEREVTTAEGNRIVSRVEVGYTHLGTLSTEEQKMLYVLIKLWEDAGKPDSQVFFSSRALARLLKKKGWGTNVIDAITKSLRKLRTIPIEWINSYYDQTKQGAVVIDRRPFTLLGDLRVVERRQDGAVNSSQGYFKFDDHVLSNLQLNYTKPVCIEEFFKLRSEIAQLIYSHIDLLLFDKNKYERRSRELFDDLGLKNPEYNHMYERKRAIEKALKELDGIRLSSGVLRSATIMKTVDGKDYKVSFSKSAAPLHALATDFEQLPHQAATPAGAIVVNDYSRQRDLLTSQAEELLLHFYKSFHGVDTHYPQSKETAQALSLITQHGLEQAKHIVSFAHNVAAASNYVPQTFGGVLQYTSRGLADFEQLRQPYAGARPQAAEPDASELTDESNWVRGRQRWLSLTEEQQQCWQQAARTALSGQNPFLARLLTEKSDSTMAERLIQRWVVRQLEDTVMDLALSNDLTAPEVLRQKLGLQNLAV